MSGVSQGDQLTGVDQLLLSICIFNNPAASLYEIELFIRMGVTFPLAHKCQIDAVNWISHKREQAKRAIMLSLLHQDKYYAGTIALVFKASMYIVS